MEAMRVANISADMSGNAVMLSASENEEDNNIEQDVDNILESASAAMVTAPAPQPLCPKPAVQSITMNQLSDSSWQSMKSSIRERNNVMYNNELMADIYFIVGSKGQTQRIPAHKYVLATGSSVFYAMFYGPLAEDRQEVAIPDVEPAAFLAMLRYLYTDEIELEADTVLATLYAAKKYILPYLAGACVKFLETSLTAKNACLLLSQSRLFEEPELMERCWQVIDAQAEKAIESDGFTEIDYHTLETVLSRETLNASELSIYNAAVRWAAHECGRRELPPSAENKRAALQRAFHLIRVPVIALTDYADDVVGSGMLTLREATDVFLYHTATRKPAIDFPTCARDGLKPRWCRRFQSSAYRTNQWRYRGRCDSIQFAVDARVFVAGFGLYGSSNGSAAYTVRLELKRAGGMLAENSTHFFSDGSSNPFAVYLDHPVQIEPDQFYTASVVLDGTELSYFGQEGMSEVTCHGVAFQFQCSSESTNGTGVQGGQIPEIIFYA
ncbi:PREDICTED: BTB/POZ domain-containing protein 6-B-like [Priapulus caudatus]|uniref:BTB/POZ domain-containing protein 6-B-like n=1 Tax=Priapulus caudatus TaxID=37621 RepID=A0ABM1E3S8_PRICU|nr:PREDICTED: BTB/POZ domain-containing protein 6-B-like [Priapulus caudatus]XP_014666849.1 PREDICTED: BTB/POZ domain-containing protein 6-B-like [Priapulus caudatus]